MKRKHYKTIEDIPIYNFKKAHKDLDMRYLLRCEDIDDVDPLTKEENAYLLKTWENINDEYLDEFGLTERYKRYLEQQKRVTLLEMELALTGDKSLKAIIKGEQSKLDDLSEGIEKNCTFEETVASVEKYQGIAINPRKVTAKQYFTYIKSMQAEAERIRSEQRRQNVKNQE